MNGRWVNSWIHHPCGDLALPFELGNRVLAYLGSHRD